MSFSNHSAPLQASPHRCLHSFMEQTRHFFHSCLPILRHRWEECMHADGSTNLFPAHMLLAVSHRNEFCGVVDTFRVPLVRTCERQNDKLRSKLVGQKNGAHPMTKISHTCCTYRTYVTCVSDAVAGVRGSCTRLRVKEGSLLSHGS